MSSLLTERESQLSIPAVIPLAAKEDTKTATPASTAPTNPSPVKGPKIKFIHSSSKVAPAVSSPLAARDTHAASSPPPEVYDRGTREPSLDTEMLSLAEPDRDVSHVPLKDVDVEMELLGE